jgi:hypothetical protein
MRIANSGSQIAMTTAVVAFALWCSVFPRQLEAQGTQGQNAVCSLSTACDTSSKTVGTNAFIDASMFANTTICSTLYNILVSPSYSAAVIDARGLNSTNTNMACATGWTPWNNGSNYLSNKPSTILLPASTITTSVPWVVPTNTKLIGIATGPGTSNLLDTTLQASGSFTSAGGWPTLCS